MQPHSKFIILVSFLNRLFFCKAKSKLEFIQKIILTRLHRLSCKEQKQLASLFSAMILQYGRCVAGLGATSSLRQWKWAEENESTLFVNVNVKSLDFSTSVIQRCEPSLNPRLSHFSQKCNVFAVLMSYSTCKTFDNSVVGLRELMNPV